MLCQSLPASTRIAAALYLAEHFSASFADGFDFFRCYEIPTWSILYWLEQRTADGRQLPGPLAEAAIAGHGMAMLLHALDDHLSDGQASPTHIALLVRSQAWQRMNEAFARLCAGLDRGPEAVAGWIDTYYRGIGATVRAASLDEYCQRFRMQMATGFIAPQLTVRHLGLPDDLGRTVLEAYGAFGVAWRLMDDLHDVAWDMAKGTLSGVYVCLPPEMQALWEGAAGAAPDDRVAQTAVMIAHITSGGAGRRLAARIKRELASGACGFDDAGLPGLADELRTLNRPLEAAEAIHAAG